VSHRDLKPSDVVRLRQMRSLGASYKTLSAKFRTSTTTVYRAIKLRDAYVKPIRDVRCK